MLSQFTEKILRGLPLAFGLFARTRIGAIQRESESVIKAGIPSVELLGRVQSRMKENDTLLFRHIWCPDEKEMQALQNQITANCEANGKELENYDKLLSDEKARASFEKVKEARARFNESFEKTLAASRAATNTELSKAVYDRATAEVLPLSQSYEKALQECLDNETTEANTSAAAIEAVTQSADRGVIIGIFGALIVGGLLAFLIINGTNQVLNRVAESIQDGSHQVSSASGQVANASQVLAQGSSEQASSLEETSSSLEEMASMTKRNSDNTRKANELAKEARAAAEKGVNDMQIMAAAMADIRASSDDISKIIKTIDEIAFQTNILALNAAVEAARAGEAGMGFAVVADEVRNLAQRCAQAARETAGKIEGAIAKTSQGVETSNKAGDVLNQIVSKVRRVDELISEVAGASREQTDGIAQINLAVGQVDQVTQSNAATAEESAAAAEELSAQADTMKRSVDELLRLVGGKKSGLATKHFNVGSQNGHVRKSALRVETPKPVPAVMREGWGSDA